MMRLSCIKSRLLNGTAVLGLDIGYSIVKLVELRKRNGNAEIRNYLFSDFDYNSSVPRSKQAEELVKGLLRENHIKTRKVVTAISNEDLIERVFYLPLSSRDKIKDIVKWEVKKHINFPMEEAVYSYITSEIEEAEKLCIYLAISKRDVVERQIELLSRVGLEPLAIETKSTALSRLIQWSHADRAKEGKIALVDIGSKSSVFVLIDKGFIRMSKYIEIGSIDITSTIVNLIHCSEKDAEELKMNIGIKEEVMNNRDSSPESVDFNVYSAIEFQMDRLISEIKRALMFYFAQFEWEGDPDIMYITGGTSRIPNIAKFLARKLSMKVEVLDPVDKFKCADCLDKGSATHLSIAFGLALREVCR